MHNDHNFLQLFSENHPLYKLAYIELNLLSPPGLADKLL